MARNRRASGNASGEIQVRYFGGVPPGGGEVQPLRRVKRGRKSGPASVSARPRGQRDSVDFDGWTTSWAFREEPSSSGRPADDADALCARSCGLPSAPSGGSCGPPCGGRAGPSVRPCGPSASPCELCGESGEPCDGPCDAPYDVLCAPFCVPPSVRTTFLEMVPMEHRFVAPIPVGCANRKFDPQLLGMACRDLVTVRSPTQLNDRVFKFAPLYRFISHFSSTRHFGEPPSRRSSDACRARESRCARTSQFQ